MSALDPKVKEERNAVIAYLSGYAREAHLHASALRADACTQARDEAWRIEGVAYALENAADEIRAGRHWRTR